MNEQQFNQYTQLIGLFLYCNNEEEREKILQDNAAIIRPLAKVFRGITKDYSFFA